MNSRTLRILWIAAALSGLGPGCSKDLPSSPAPGAGTPVIVTGNSRIGASSNLVFEDGKVKNQSGITIYNVRVVLEVWRNAPVAGEYADTSAVLFLSMAHGVEQDFAPLHVSADAFLGVFAVYEILPP